MTTFSDLYTDITNLLGGAVNWFTHDGQALGQLATGDAHTTMTNGGWFEFNLSGEASNSPIQTMGNGGSVKQHVYAAAAGRPGGASYPQATITQLNNGALGATLPNPTYGVTPTQAIQAILGMGAGAVPIPSVGNAWAQAYIAETISYLSGLAHSMENDASYIVPLAEAATAAITLNNIDLKPLQKEVNALEITALAGFVALGAQEVVLAYGLAGAAESVMAAMIATMQAATEAVIAEILAAFDELGAQGNKDLQPILDRLGPYPTDLATYLEELLSVTKPDGSKITVSEFLAQCQVMVGEESIFTLERAYVQVGTVKVPLSDALKGLLYYDTAGDARHAVLTLLAGLYHVILE